MKKCDVFVSYSGTQGKRVAEAFHQGLPKYVVQQGMQESDLNVFVAHRSIDPGTDWQNEILKNLKEADWFLFVVTGESDISPYAQQELGAAWALGKNIIPIWGDERNQGQPPPELPGFLKKWQAIDLNDPFNQETTGAMIGKIVGKKKADIEAERQKKQNNDFLKVAGIVGILALLLKK